MEISMVSSTTAIRRPPLSSQDVSDGPQAEKERDEEEYDDDDDVTVIILDAPYPPAQSRSSATAVPHSALVNASFAADYDDPQGEFRRAQQSLARQQTRRNEMVQELRVVERSSFRLFLMILVVPVVLLVVAVAAVVSDDVDCSGMAAQQTSGSGTASEMGNSSTQQPGAAGGASCWNDQRTFRNAFSTRCICDSVPASNN
jgi:hypothetical protein